MKRRTTLLPSWIEKGESAVTKTSGRWEAKPPMDPHLGRPPVSINTSRSRIRSRLLWRQGRETQETAAAAAGVAPQIAGSGEGHTSRPHALARGARHRALAPPGHCQPAGTHERASERARDDSSTSACCPGPSIWAYLAVADTGRSTSVGATRWHESPDTIELKLLKYHSCSYVMACMDFFSFFFFCLPGFAG